MQSSSQVDTEGENNGDQQVLTQGDDEGEDYGQEGESNYEEEGVHSQGREVAALLDAGDCSENERRHQKEGD